jgi:hypothetical protein
MKVYAYVIRHKGTENLIGKVYRKRHFAEAQASRSPRHWEVIELVARPSDEG